MVKQPVLIESNKRTEYSSRFLIGYRTKTVKQDLQVEHYAKKIGQNINRTHHYLWYKMLIFQG